MRAVKLVCLPLFLLTIQCASSDGDAVKQDDGGDGDSRASGGVLGVASGGAEHASGGTVEVGAGGAERASGGAVSGTGGRAASGSGGVDSAAGGSDPEGPGEDCVVDLNCTPELLPTSGDFGQDCVDRINQFRVDCSCLPPLERWVEAEACAEANAVYDQGTEQAHSGWRGEACSADSGPLSVDMNGWATNECPGPYYDSPNDVLARCLPAMYGEGAEWAKTLGRAPTQADLAACDGSCYNENGHFIAMTKEGHTLVACGVTPTGDIWSVQNFK